MSDSERVDLRRVMARLTPGEGVIAASSVVLLLALFLDWVSVSCAGAFCNGVTSGASGFRGWGWLTFLSLLLVAGLLVARRLLGDRVVLPELPAPDPTLYMVGGALEIAGCVLFWLEYHDAFASSGAGALTVSSGLGFGWFLALLAGVATLGGGYLMSRDPVAASAPTVAPPPHSPAPPPPLT